MIAGQSPGYQLKAPNKPPTARIQEIEACGVSGSVTAEGMIGAQAFRISAVRLPSANSIPAGSYDNNSSSSYYGTFLHVSAVLGECGADLVSPQDQDSNANALAIPLLEWDPQGVEIFPPGCTVINYVGGSGRWGVSGVQVPIVRHGYKPRRRTLLRYCSGNPLVANSSFVVPSGHTRIGCLSNNVAVFNASDNTPIFLVGGVSQPIPSGTIINNTSGDNLLLWTEFKA